MSAINTLKKHSVPGFLFGVFFRKNSKNRGIFTIKNNNSLYFVFILQKREYINQLEKLKWKEK